MVGICVLWPLAHLKRAIGAADQAHDELLLVLHLPGAAEEVHSEVGQSSELEHDPDGRVGIRHATSLPHCQAVGHGCRCQGHVDGLYGDGQVALQLGEEGQG
jgi:hypothetical protein